MKLFEILRRDYFPMLGFSAIVGIITKNILLFEYMVFVINMYTSVGGLVSLVADEIKHAIKGLIRA